MLFDQGPQLEIVVQGTRLDRQVEHLQQEYPHQALSETAVFHFADEPVIRRPNHGQYHIHHEFPRLQEGVNDQDATAYLESIF